MLYLVTKHPACVNCPSAGSHGVYIQRGDCQGSLPNTCRKTDMLRKKFFVIAMTAVLSVLAGSAHAAIHFDFEDGTFQGWSNILGDSNHVFTPTNTPGIGSAASGSWAVDVLPFSNRDTAHNTLLARSPEFFLNESGDLTISLAGGQGAGMYGQAGLPSGPSQIASTTSINDGVHAMGIGLRLVGSNTYVATAQRTTNGENWQTLTISQATLAPYVSPTARYTLDVYDSFAGGWSWISFDNAMIPGTLVPEPSSLGVVTMLIAAAGLRRR